MAFAMRGRIIYTCGVRAIRCQASDRIKNLPNRKTARPLPPLDYIVAFEAAAKSMSFAGASEQLHISESAISRKVRLLEQHFGRTFFLRGSRSIKLTQQGQHFLAKVSPALENLRSASEELLEVPANKPVVLAATNSVASLWLTPRLHEFRKSNPHLRIMLVSSDNDEECLGESVDITILRGSGNWPEYNSSQLFGETVFPVCSPEFLSANPECTDIANLPNLPLIEVASDHAEWMNWKTWLSHLGFRASGYDQPIFFNTYPLSIQAAVDGAGVALGWGHLVDRLLESGQLVRPCADARVRTSDGYYLLVPHNCKPSPARDEVVKWLLELSAKRVRYGEAVT